MRTLVGRSIAATLVLLGGCTLSSVISIEPLHLLPNEITRPTSLSDAVNRGNYRYAARMAENILSETEPDPRELALLGRAQLYCARYDEATESLNRALEHSVSRSLRARIEWDLAQTAYLSGRLEDALELTEKAGESGIDIRSWYIDFLEALQGVDVHSIEEPHATVVDFSIGEPDLPRLRVSVNDAASTDVVLDSGAVMSIVSHSFAEKARIDFLQDVEGTFYGLLGEPIPVTFGLIDSVRIGEMTIRNLPVAVMRDQKLSFFVNETDRFDIDFLIGNSLLSEFRLQFDYARQALKISFIKHEDRRPAEDQNLFLVDQKPLVHVAINRQGWYPFLLDTGSEVTFLNRSKFSIREIMYGVPRYHGATMQGLGGAQKSGLRVKDVSIGIGRWAGLFEDIPLYEDERPGAVGIVGQNFLKNFYVDIDFGRMRVEIERQGPDDW